MFDSNSKNRFHTSTDNCGVNPPDDKTLSNNTLVLLSSATKNFILSLQSLPCFTRIYRSNATSIRCNSWRIRDCHRIVSSPAQRCETQHCDLCCNNIPSARQLQTHDIAIGCLLLPFWIFHGQIWYLRHGEQTSCIERRSAGREIVRKHWIPHPKLHKTHQRRIHIR